MKLCKYNYNIISMYLLGKLRIKITDLFTPDIVYITIITKTSKKEKSEDFFCDGHIYFIKEHQQTRFRHKFSGTVGIKFEEGYLLKNFNAYTFDSTEKTMKIEIP